jgi:hypothetical protein
MSFQDLSLDRFFSLSLTDEWRWRRRQQQRRQDERTCIHRLVDDIVASIKCGHDHILLLVVIAVHQRCAPITIQAYPFKKKKKKIVGVRF